jgi:hypothetical protein
MTADFLTCETGRCHECRHDDCGACRLLTELLQDTTEEWHEGQVMSGSRNLKTTKITLSYCQRRRLTTQLTPS